MQARVADGNQHDELFLIDGNSLAYRAFFALPESIATSTGFPTNAIFGFASMLVKLLTDYGSKPTVVVWDAGSSGRKEVSADYKATRTVAPEPAQGAVAAPRAARRGVRLSQRQVPGFEADDVIASIAERARGEGVPVMVVTGDRDAFQIIDPDSKVRVMATGRGITDTKVYDHQAVIDRYGIAPELIPDFYGLKGDTSDNIPGVPGHRRQDRRRSCCSSSASLESVLDHIDDISGAKRKQNLDRARRQRAGQQAARDDHARRPRRGRPDRRGGAAARPLEAARGLPRVRAALPAAAPRGGVRRRRQRRRPRRSPSGRSPRACARARSPTSRRSASTPRSRSPPARRAARGRAVRRGRDVALRRRDRRPRARRRLRRPGGVRRRARRPPGDRPRRQGAARSSRRTSSTTRCSPPTCSSPPAAASRSARSARSAAWRATSPTRSAPRPCSSRRSPPGSASSSRTAA